MLTIHLVHYGVCEEQYDRIIIYCSQMINDIFYQCLKGLCKSDVERLEVTIEEASSVLKQGGDAWHELRKQAKLTG